MAKTLEKLGPKEILEHCEEIGLDVTSMASCLAVNPKTIQRWRESSAQPNEGGMRALEKLELIYQLMARVLKKSDARAWLHSPNETLGGAAPVEFLSRGELDAVRDVLGMLEWGIYS